MNIREVDASELVRGAADMLMKAGIEKPAYVEYVKSSPSRERSPAEGSFWYLRCASLLRQVYLNGPIGISRLRIRYGGRKRHVVHRHHSVRAGGSIIKDAFDALERLGYVKKTKKGREITPKGISFLDKTASAIAKGGA